MHGNLDKLPAGWRYGAVNSISRSLVLATLTSLVVQAEPEATFTAGSEALLTPLAEAKWIQGEPLKVYEPDKVYIFECWATWCGPCVAAIPHLNELHTKFFDKGLRVYGINVWEDDAAKVAAFVSKKGDGMSYPVAYTGKGSAFETEWLKAAGVKGIPHAFVVRNGKLVIGTHPSKITEEFITALLSGSQDAQATVDEMNQARKKQEESMAILKAFRRASGLKDIEGMEDALGKLREKDPKSSYLESFGFELLIAKKDWPAAIERLQGGNHEPKHRMMLTMMANRVGMGRDGDYPPEFIQALAKEYARLVTGVNEPTHPMGLVILASLQWKADDKTAALESAKRAVATADGLTPAGERQVPRVPFEKFVASLEADKLPDSKEFFGWMRENMPSKDAEKAKASPPSPAASAPVAPPEMGKGE